MKTPPDKVKFLPDKAKIPPNKVKIPLRLRETGTLTAEIFDWTSVFLRRIRPRFPGFPC